MMEQDRSSPQGPQYAKGQEMISKVVPVVLLLAIGACAQQPSQPAQSGPETTFAAAQPAPPLPPAAPSDAQIAPGKWNVDRARCSDLLDASDEDRAAAAMFYYGYLAAKAGIHIIDVSQVDTNVSKVMSECAHHQISPCRKPFAELLADTRRLGSATGLAR
jgi:hypothetical protein